ncbi:thiamine pyrophosphate-dependent enzyme [uncultured Thalassospira sp.]|uniref:thiamine pyrophosphate-dependent enzyme n=1 Tax=uncultured Thalassospira sp. TaxID=404382 RepID=UPI0030DD03F8
MLCLATDGCFLMHRQEFATIAQYGENIIVVAINNGMFGTRQGYTNHNRQHNSQKSPRVSAKQLRRSSGPLPDDQPQGPVFHQ